MVLFTTSLIIAIIPQAIITKEIFLRNAEFFVIILLKEKLLLLQSFQNSSIKIKPLKLKSIFGFIHLHLLLCSKIYEIKWKGVRKISNLLISISVSFFFF